MSKSKSLKIKSSPSSATTLGVPIYTLGGDKLRICGNDYESPPEIYKASSYTGYTLKTIKNENDILRMNTTVNDLGYTGVGGGPSDRKTSLTITLPKLVEQI